MDGRSARGLRHRGGQSRRGLRGHVAGRQGVPHRRRQGHRILQPQGALYLVAGRSARRRALRRHRATRARSSASTAPGKGELYYDTGQSHITGLAVDSQGRLLAGTEPNGILYRISAKDKAFVLYDASLPEIRAIVPDAGRHGVCRGAGRVGGEAAQPAPRRPRRPRPPAEWPTATSTTITVEAQAGPGGDIKPADSAKRSPPRVTPTPQVTTQFNPVVDVSGVEKSAVYRINPDNTVETLWSSKEENVYDLLALERQILFSTDENGRIYGLSPDRRVTLVTETNEGRNHPAAAFRTLRARRHRQHGPHLPAGRKARRGRILRSAGARFRHGFALGQPQLARRPAGRMHPHVPHALRQLRQARPHLERLVRSRFRTPPGRASPAPMRATSSGKRRWPGTEGATPLLNSVTLAYLPQNSPPVLKSINVIMQAVAASQSAKQSVASSAAYSVTVSDSGDATSSTSAGTPTQTLTRAANQQITVVWHGGGSRQRPPGLQRLFPRRGRDPVAAAEERSAREFHHLRRRHPGRRQVLFPRRGFRPRSQPAFERARSPVGQRPRHDRQHAARRDHRPGAICGGRRARRVRSGRRHLTAAPLRVFARRRELGSGRSRRWRDRFAAREVHAGSHRPRRRASTFSSSAPRTVRIMPASPKSC